MPFKVSEKIQGLQESIRALQGIGKAGKAALKKEVTTGSKTLLREAKSSCDANVRKRTGLTKKSLGRKVKVYRHTGAVVALVGPRRGFRTQIGVRVKGGRKSNPGDPIFADPARTSHLVELGTKRSRKFPFMTKALDVSRPRIEEQIAKGLAEAINRLGGK